MKPEYEFIITNGYGEISTIPGSLLSFTFLPHNDNNEFILTDCFNEDCLALYHCKTGLLADSDFHPDNINRGRLLEAMKNVRHYKTVAQLKLEHATSGNWPHSKIAKTR